MTKKRKKERKDYFCNDPRHDTAAVQKIFAELPKEIAHWKRQSVFICNDEISAFDKFQWEKKAYGKLLIDKAVVNALFFEPIEVRAWVEGRGRRPSPKVLANIPDWIVRIAETEVRANRAALKNRERELEKSRLAFKPLSSNCRCA